MLPLPLGGLSCHSGLNAKRGSKQHQELRKNWRMRLALVLLVAPLAGQAQEIFDITPLFGYSSSVSFPLTITGTENSSKAQIAASESFGIAAGFRYQGDQVIEFRYLRQSSTMRLEGLLSPAPQPLFNPAILEHYLGDFTHEFVLPDSAKVRPFVTASLGMARIAVAAQSYNRFSFAIGGGVKWFPLRHIGFRLQAEWLPIWLNPEIKGFICGGGCAVAFGGALASQGQASLGPVFTF